MNRYKCESEKSRYSNIGQQWEKAVWFTHEDDRYLMQEKIMVFLGSRFSFVTIYKNGRCLKDLTHLSGDQIAEIMDSSTTIADVFEYCREHFCKDLAPVKRNAKPAKADDQLDMFEAMA